MTWILRAAAALMCALALGTIATPQGRAIVNRVATLGGLHAPVAPLRPGDSVPTLRFTALDGTAAAIFDPGALRGTTVFNVFTSWCPSCREEAPALARVAATLQPRGVRFVGVDQAEPPQTVRALVAEQHLPYDVVIDDSGAVSKQLFGARMIPTTVVVKDGRVTGVAYGPLTEAQMRTLVALQ